MTTDDDTALTARRGHNGGPPLDDPHRPEWGVGPVGNYFHWKAATRRAWRASAAEKLRRLKKAEALGLTYREYTLEILDRGRYLNEGDAARIAEIKQARGDRRTGA